MKFPKSIFLLFVLGIFTCVVVVANDAFLPLGDGHVSTAPQVGYIYSCQQNFAGEGAFRAGGWIMGDVWDPEAKPVVRGAVLWPNANISEVAQDNMRMIETNDLPSHPTGEFPIRPSDKAYQFDRNPNSIKPQSVIVRMPLNPQPAAQPNCVPMGMIGIALTGAEIFNGLDGQGRDAAAHEIQDACGGHPERQGQYHYHSLSPCMKDDAGKSGQHSDLVGYALDGFGIYGQFGENGKPLTDNDLDACHGHTHEVLWNGKLQTIYHYHLTREYPYTIGCFHGAVMQQTARAGSHQENILDLQPTDTSGAMLQPQPGAESAQRGMPDDHRRILENAAHEFGIDPEKLRQALGSPPPDFPAAARTLGIDEDQLRAAFDRARSSN